MNGPIDIIVTYVDSSKENWKKEYNHYVDIELQNGVQSRLNHQAFGDERFRDWGFFKYWFRGVEQNCSWVNKVFVVLADEEQIPDWLDTTNPKLRIVYHHEFIPAGLLPTFNGLVLDMWYYRIPDLSENFIVCDDDYYFLNSIPDNLFFEDNIPCTTVRLTNQFFRDPYYTRLSHIDETYGHIRDNTLAFALDYIHAKKYVRCIASHLPEARIKSFEKQIAEASYQLFYDAFAISRFRHKNNYEGILYSFLLRMLGMVKDKPNMFTNSQLISLGDPTLDINIISTKDMICLNDSESTGDTIDNCSLLSMFQNKFPMKSSFEKEV